jgi:nitrogen regulatory protein PII
MHVDRSLACLTRTCGSPVATVPNCRLKDSMSFDSVAAITAITTDAHTGKVGGGKIFVLDVEQCIRIRTGETGVVGIG